MLMQRCDTPLLLAATRCAIDLAEARGWSAATTAGVFYGLKAVLDGHTSDDPVPLSQVRQRVRPRSHSSATRIAEVLSELERPHHPPRPLWHRAALYRVLGSNTLLPPGDHPR
ncbi:MAG: hypothetical protein ABSB59_32835 [Streptosporangiaceae bacterium]|jgi:hypothetical protein